MNITAEEKLMYEVMKAIYESGIPISFKGSMVLRACLMEEGYAQETRHTVDIDGNWNSDTAPSSEQMLEALQNVLDKSGISLKIRLYRMYGAGRSAGFELVDSQTEEVIFTMDIDVNRPEPPTKIYEVDGFRFRGVAPVQMIADKLAVISSDKIFRRIKDVVDLYFISKVYDLDCGKIADTLKNSERTLGDFNSFLHREDELKRSYEKFRFDGNLTKPLFDDVYNSVLSFIKELIP